MKLNQKLQLNRTSFHSDESRNEYIRMKSYAILILFIFFFFSCKQKENVYLVDFKIYKNGALSKEFKVDLSKRRNLTPIINELQTIINDEESYFEVFKEISNVERFSHKEKSGELNVEIQEKSKFNIGPYRVIKEQSPQFPFGLKTPDGIGNEKATALEILIHNKLDQV